MDHCYSNVTKNIYFEKDIHSLRLNISEKLQENQGLKVVFWKDSVFPLSKINQVQFA